VNTTVNTQSYRPYPNIGQFSNIQMAGHSSYNGLQVTARRQFTGNFSFIANYSWSKAIDDGDGLAAQCRNRQGGIWIAPGCERNQAIEASERARSFVAIARMRWPHRSRGR